MSRRRWWGWLLLLLASGCTPSRPPSASNPQVYVVGYTDAGAFHLRVPNGRIAGEIGAIRVAEVRLSPPELEDLRRQGLLRYAQPASSGMRLVEPVGASPLPQGLDFQWYLQAVHSDALEPLGGGAGVEVAVLDTGIDATHPDLAGALLPGIDALTGGSLPPDRDFSAGMEHGTHVAGVLVAHGRVRGLAPAARLLPVRIFAPDYVGDFRAAQAMVEGANRGAKVFNLSFGGYAFPAVLYDAVTYVLQRGGWVLAAAGNQGDTRPFYPAAFPGVIAVGAAGATQTPTDFSNRGTWVDLYAPGVNIFSTLPGDRYGFLSGTSMASPVVAGIASVLRGVRPNLDAWGLAWLFRRYGTDATKLVAGYRDAPYGGCLRVQIMRNGAPQEAWLELDFGDGERYAIATDYLGNGKFFGVPQGAATLRVVVGSSAARRIHTEPVRAFRSCAWTRVVDIGE